MSRLSESAPTRSARSTIARRAESSSILDTRGSLWRHKVSKASLWSNPTFLRMAYEMAFTEYAIVLAQELSTAQYYFDARML